MERKKFMKTSLKSAANAEWKDGFPFLGNHVSLDFLNTCPLMNGEPVEMLGDVPAVARWLRAAGLIGPGDAPSWEWNPPADADKQIAALREFREAFRAEIVRVEAGEPVSPIFLDRLNEILRLHAGEDRVAMTREGLVRQRNFALKGPVEALGPIADAAAELLTREDDGRVRKCASCPVQFLDTSKKGTRRWCSMNLCGNRSKVAAYTLRKQALGGQ